jgi:hypothetical protein
MPTKKKRLHKEGSAINTKEKPVKKPEPGQREPAGLGGGAVIQKEEDQQKGQRQQAERDNPRDKRVEADQNRGQTYNH